MYSAHETMTSSESVAAEHHFGPFHRCQKINMVLPRRILRHADSFATEIGICSLDDIHVFEAGYPGSARSSSALRAPAGGRARMASRNMFDRSFGITF